MAENGFVLATDDGEGFEDVGGVFAGVALEMEGKGVATGAQVAVLFIVPNEGRDVVAPVSAVGVRDNQEVRGAHRFPLLLALVDGAKLL